MNTGRDVASGSSPSSRDTVNWREELAFLLVSAAANVIGMFLYRRGSLFKEWDIFIIFGLLVMLGPLVARCFKPAPPSDKYRALRFTFFLLWTCGAMLTLQNWQQVQLMLQERPISTAILIAVTAFLVFKLIQRIGSGVENVTLRGWRKLFLIAPWLLFYLFARRSDTSNVDGASFHWEYFVGPVRVLRNGGLMLWDTPSQYGFLNAIIPSWLPFSTSWSAFYWFQAALLFIAAGVYYLTLTKPLMLPRTVACLLVIGTLFLAYPPLIGPTPYPSSSAARFIWCYVMLFLAAACFLGPKPAFGRYIWLGSILWPLSTLWSGESAIYNTTIFWAPIGLHIFLVALGGKNNGPPIWKCLLLPLAGLAVALAIVTVCYIHTAGVRPDFSMMFVYNTAYSAGFGSSQISRIGAIWFYLLLIATSTFALRLVLGRDANAGGPAGALISALACIMVVSSYYIGRAVPNNVVAEYPILVMSLLIILKATAKGTQIAPSQYALALPILVVALLSPFWNDMFPPTLKAVFRPQSDVESHLPVVDNELSSLLKTAHVTPDKPLVYYGYAGEMGAIPGPDGRPQTFEKTWLPNPLQLLEVPISPGRREQIIDRFLARNKRSGYLVWKRGEAEDRFADWKLFLQQRFTLNQTWENKDYQILYYTPR